MYTFKGDDFHIKHNRKYLALTAASLNIIYLTPQCLQYVNTTTLSNFYSNLYKNEMFQDNLFPDEASQDEIDNPESFGVEDCQLGRDVICRMNDSATETCRINIRMSAAITLAICLMIKTTCMIILNVKSRRKIKISCLTFGDVIAASAFDVDLRIRNECLLNADEGNRHRVEHTCHKHCKETKLSRTGDNVDHCQKCKKFNIVNKAFNLSHPCIAIKCKKSLLLNLGFTALLQMIILIFCALSMLGISV